MVQVVREYVGAVPAAFWRPRSALERRDAQFCDALLSVQRADWPLPGVSFRLVEPR